MMRDSSIYNDPNFIEFAERTVADAGYRGDVYVVTHPNGSENSLDLYNCYTNYELKQIRCEIEREFGILKKTFNVLYKPWAMSREFHDPALRVCVCLHNFRLRGEDFILS